MSVIAIAVMSGLCTCHCGQCHHDYMYTFFHNVQIFNFQAQTEPTVQVGSQTIESLRFWVCVCVSEVGSVGAGTGLVMHATFVLT